MTSEPDTRPRGRPPTIDLTATEIEAEKPAREAAGGAADASRQAGDGAQSAADNPAGRNSAGGLKPLAIGAVLGAIVVAVLGVGAWFAGIVPLPHQAASTVQPPRVASAPATPAIANAPQANAAAEIAAKLDKIQAELQQRQSDSRLAGRLASVEAQTKTLGDSLAALNRRLDGVVASVHTALERANAASASGKGTGAVQKSDLDALAKRIAVLESSVKTLSTARSQPAPNINDRVARAALAAEALRANVERGAPYAAELTALKSFGADPHAIAALEPFAANGVPTAAALTHELAALIPSLSKASGAAPGSTASSDSFLGRLESRAKGLVRITPIDAPPPAGNQASAVIARLSADAAREDIAAALADISNLPQAAASLAAPWAQKAKARNATVAASRRIAGDALAQLASPNTSNTQ
jgi:hypothetical protein